MLEKSIFPSLLEPFIVKIVTSSKKMKLKKVIKKTETQNKKNHLISIEGTFWSEESSKVKTFKKSYSM